jgi:hypothetical protein
MKKFPLVWFAALTALPAFLVGGAIWYFAGSLPGCSIEISERLTSSDARFDLGFFHESAVRRPGLTLRQH